VECTIAIITPAGLNFVFARDFLDVDDSLLQLGAELPVYRDAAGEINNMVAGTFRNMLSKTKLHCSLTPPFILDGYAPLLSSLAKAHTAVIAAFNVEEFVTTVCLWT
jgi:CheY-specific phosphatase CheX